MPAGVRRLPPPGSEIVARRFVINGRFLRGKQGGVQRVGREILGALAHLLSADRALAQLLECELVVPAGLGSAAAEIGLSYREGGFLSGVAWEQFSLPQLAGTCAILSLCNSAPIISRRAITMIQDAQVWSAPSSYGFLFRQWYRCQQPIIGRRHLRTLTVSEFSRQELIAHNIVHVDRCEVIFNGADHALRATPDAAALVRLGLTPGSYALALANTQPHKNIGMLIRAFGSSPLLKDTKLVLFGAAQADDFRKAGFAPGPQVVFAGQVTDGELWGLMRQAACLAFPSLTEGFGLPPLEAMHHNCPVVAAPTGALPETCGPAAIYADPAAPDDWASAIASLTSDGAQRQALVRAGQAWVEPLTWKRAATHLADVLLRADWEQPEPDAPRRPA